MENTKLSGEIPEIQKLGREIKISPKSVLRFNSEGYLGRFEVDILIGKCTAKLSMPVDAFQEFRNGEEISTKSVSQFKKEIK